MCGAWQLSQGRDVIQDPEAAAMGSDCKIVVFDDQVADRCGRHVEPERLPVFAIVEGNVNSALRSGEEQSFPLRVFAHGVHGLSVWNSFHDLLPGLTRVAGPVNVRAYIIEAQSVDRGI